MAAGTACVERPIELLSDQERIAYYRELAVDALKCALDAETDGLRVAYADIAARWSVIADEAQRLMLQEHDLSLHIQKNETKH